MNIDLYDFSWLLTVLLEKFAVNAGFDADGERQHFDIDQSSAIAYKTSLDTNFWAKKLSESGIPALVSNHAGSYLCNFIYYKSLKFTQERGGDALFVHIPYTTEMVCDLCINQRKSFPSLPESQLIRALKMLLEGINTIII